MGFPMLGSGFLLGSLQGPLTHTAGVAPVQEPESAAAI